MAHNQTMLSGRVKLLQVWLDTIADLLTRKPVCTYCMCCSCVLVAIMKLTDVVTEVCSHHVLEN